MEFTGKSANAALTSTKVEPGLFNIDAERSEQAEPCDNHTTSNERGQAGKSHSVWKLREVALLTWIKPLAGENQED
jgi:hypothetical protein